MPPAMTLVAYTIGLIPFVLIRSVVAPFLARGDTCTPMKAALIGTAVNIVFKFALMGSLAQVGLALATSIGAWINFILVLWLAARAGHIAADATLKSSLVKLAVAGVAMAIMLLLAAPLVSLLFSSWLQIPQRSGVGRAGTGWRGVLRRTGARAVRPPVAFAAAQACAKSAFRADRSVRGYVAAAGRPRRCMI